MVSEWWTIPDDIDPECIPICQFLNALLGVETLESCSGHGNYPLRVWFTIDETGNLRDVLQELAESEYFSSRIEVELNGYLELIFMYEEDK